ncbi:cis-2,3-dihydrobiphenyl-2,3-diol dehydrogenase [Novosphingobium hassiacum]|uniref:Cis-2,3-dihydrobiphenyl-2,3-diol dehydrogenase n=1 Tax=Novosphingobium hassiacum TaxID=173676 RepID=A0A7W6A2A4_9SPHN|nr:3-(cis-5,6-dihydroxycyclohexa-1,3-dien-1-yl)propanoate dehydrogenase [Novosphingobium hassiacum]MBB3862889.1 cis-2,3-dihydrobiphenyl-2,3-diol dehydrogenase [Novosphingobium hassiacum]
MNWLDDRVALITGGGSGLGSALVERFLREGARVTVLERSEDNAATLKGEFGKEVEIVMGDVTRYEDNLKAVARAVDRFGKIDTFIANAGVFDFFKSLISFPGEEISSAFDELFAINVKGGLLGARAAVPELLKTRGNIIFTVSNAGFYAGGGGPLYTASKHALVGVIRQLAHELAPKIRVNGVAPGAMQTGLSGLHADGSSGRSLKDSFGFSERVVSSTPLRLCSTPEQNCAPYVLLASNENSSPITGTIINTDGGLGVRGLATVCGGDEL